MKQSKAPIWISVALIFSLLVSVATVVCIHIGIFPFAPSSAILRAHVMCGAFGVLGASMASLRKLYRALITESTLRANEKQFVPLVWDFGWVLYYLTRPLLGGVLGALSYTLSLVGFQILTGHVDAKISSQGRYLLYALAVLFGFSVSHALDRMNSVAKDILSGPKKTEEK